MTDYRSDFLSMLSARGYINQVSDVGGLDELLAGERVTAYIGFDCTGPSLHVGHMMGIMMLRRFQQAGHRPIVLMGGGTTRIGDPSGRDETRQLLTPEKIEANKASIFNAFSRFLDFEGDNPAVQMDNAAWLLDLNYVEFLRDVGRHFSVNRMLTFDSVRTRLDREHPLSFIEFNYMILQAYDFVELNRRTGCRLQMGGSDQWGNIVNGIDLGRRMGTPELFALTCPLITTASGAKMGKTAAGAVWLNADMTTPWDYWQFWRNTEDSDVGRFMRLFTDLPEDEIARLETLDGAAINEAKKILATEATALLHGRDVAEEAAATAATTFETGGLAEGLPSVAVPRHEFEAGLGVLSAFVRTGLATSNGEARRAVRGGGARLNDDRLDDDRRVLGLGDVNEGVVKLSLGRKKHALLRLV